MYLERLSTGGYGLKPDVRRWAREEYLRTPEPQRGIKTLAFSFLNIFDPYYWFAEDKSMYLYEKEYQVQKQIKEGDVVGGWWKVAEPGMMIPISFGVGASIGTIFRGVSAAAVGVKGITGKVLSGFATKGPWVIGGTFAGLTGADIGMTAAYEEKELVPKGTTMAKTAQYSTQLIATGLGARWAMNYKHVPKFDVSRYQVMGKPEMIKAQRYMPLFGKQIRYGSKMYGLKTDSMIGMDTKPGMPYKPEGLATYPDVYRAVGPSVPVFKFKGKYGFVTDVGWQPKPVYEPSPFEISTLVYPKIKPYRAYETHFFVVSYTKPLFRITPKISIKPFKPKHFAVKDIIKPDKTEKGIVVGERQQTILKPPKLETKMILEEPTQLKIEMQQPKQIFKELSKIHTQRQKTMQKQVFKMLYGMDVTSKTKQDKVQAQMIGIDYAFSQKQLEKTALVVPSAVGLFEEQRYRFKPMMDFVFPTIPKTPFKPLEDIITPSKPIIPKPKPPKPPPKILELPSGTDKPLTIGKPVVQGYQVMIKTRQYVHGKPQGSEKYRPLTRKPLGYKDAMSLMGSALDHSIAQSGFIKPVDKPAKKLHKRIPSVWDSISHKFDIKKDKYVEARPYAIDTKGEVKELDVYRWYQQLPAKKIKKGRGQRLTSDFSMDMYNFDMVQFDMNKMFGRVGL